jgi:predicted MPP superfamily phosphohydrolase
LFSVLVVSSIFFYTQNNFIQITDIDIQSPDILNEIKIVHLSDLHGKEFGKSNSFLIHKVKEQKPDIMVFTFTLS